MAERVFHRPRRAGAAFSSCPVCQSPAGSLEETIRPEPGRTACHLRDVSVSAARLANGQTPDLVPYRRYLLRFTRAPRPGSRVAQYRHVDGPEGRRGRPRPLRGAAQRGSAAVGGVARASRQLGRVSAGASRGADLPGGNPAEAVGGPRTVRVSDHAGAPGIERDPEWQGRTPLQEPLDVGGFRDSVRDRFDQRAAPLFSHGPAGRPRPRYLDLQRHDALAPQAALRYSGILVFCQYRREPEHLGVQRHLQDCQRGSGNPGCGALQCFGRGGPVQFPGSRIPGPDGHGLHAGPGRVQPVDRA